MKHLIISREYPPAAYAPGGIGTYVKNIATLLAERGEQVHVIGQRWSGAPLEREVTQNGNLIVHRIGENDTPRRNDNVQRLEREREGLKKTKFPRQWFSWSAAFLIERLIEDEGIDVIEAQEWEAPLYHFLLRRSLGMGPAQMPPCIVHLHSPTEWISRFNGPPALPREYLAMKRMETFCIRSADAWLCPSNYFARQAEVHYGLAAGSVKVIHLPKGPTPSLPRSRDIWADGSICFVGRLEPRKGVIEWIEAAKSVARTNQQVHFDFIGADVWNLQSSLVKGIPLDLRSRFRFHGSKSAGELAGFLSKARAAVVPSRWENFPNVCVEAMASGLPVIATRCGGMAEIVDNGRTGWLTPDGSVTDMVEGLTDALKRCLAASPETRAEMGALASSAIARICDNRQIVEHHVAFRTEVLQAGVHRSLSLGDSSTAVSHGRFSGDAGIVLSASTVAEAETALQAIALQSEPAAIVALALESPVSSREMARIDDLLGQRAVTLFCPAGFRGEAWNRGYDAINERVQDGFVLFLDVNDVLQPDCLVQMRRVFERRPDLGLLTPWVGRDHGPPLDAPLGPDLDHQLVRNEAGPATAFRRAAIGRETPFRPLPHGYDLWRLSMAVLAAGWTGATIPVLLAERHGRDETVPWPDITALRAMRAEILQAAAGRVSPAALDLVNDYVPLPLGVSETGAERSSLAQVLALLKGMARRRVSRVSSRLLRIGRHRKVSGYVGSDTV